ncbi:hypothetical protein GE09DRAFT_1279171 [Coniochaeta sp. 2T2.1]|nr:hypothetical protein GE09DRAFT_1279171 [Coniochaeta sp. 2T2.1]
MNSQPGPTSDQASIEPPAKRRKVVEKSSGSQSSDPATNTLPNARADRWLTSHYGGTSVITLTFQDTDRKYFLAREILVKNFEYFEGALRTNGDQPVFREGLTRCFNFQDISTHTFSFILRWSSFEYMLVSRSRPKVDGLLEALMAADYLGFKVMKQFTNFISARLAVELLLNRRKLTSAHLDLVARHNTSPNRWTNVVWEIFVKAGVRPFVQDFFADLDESSIRRWKEDEVPGVGPAPGHGDIEQWKDIVRHCRQLREENDKYALQVGKAVVQMLKEERLRGVHNTGTGTEGGLVYVDPLSKVDKVSCYKGHLDKKVSLRFAI